MIGTEDLKRVSVLYGIGGQYHIMTIVREGIDKARSVGVILGDVAIEDFATVMNNRVIDG